MSVNRTILKNKVKLSGVPTEGLKIIYDWNLPDPVSNFSVSQTETLGGSHYMIFNTVYGGDRHCKDLDVNYASTEVNPGFSIGQDHGVSAYTGHANFMEREAVFVSESNLFESYTIFFDIQQLLCNTSKDRSSILLTNRSNVDDAGGFLIGINGANSLFYEYFNKYGVKKIKTFFRPLGEKALIAISKSTVPATLSINVYDPVSAKSFSKTFDICDEKNSFTPWVIGSTQSLLHGMHEEYMSLRSVIESFVLVSQYLSGPQISNIFEAFLLTNYTEERYEDVNTPFPKPGRHVKIQVEDGMQISGYTYTESNMIRQDGSGMTVNKRTPTYETKYKNITQYVNSGETVTRKVPTLIPESKTFDSQKVREYGQKAVFLSSDIDSSKTFEVYSCDIQSGNVGKRASFNPSGSKFDLDQAYDSSININIYLNGLLIEPSVDYTITGKSVTKTNGNFINTDKLYYDVLPDLLGGAGFAQFSDFTGYNGSIYIQSNIQLDVYIDGKKLIYAVDYVDTTLGGSPFLMINGGNLSSGRMGLVPRNTDITQRLDSANQSSYLLNFNFIDEQIWVDGKRLSKDLEYFLKNACDLNISDYKAEQKTTLIYNNEGTFFNI